MLIKVSDIGSPNVSSPLTAFSNAARGDPKRRTRRLPTPHAGISDALNGVKRFFSPKPGSFSPLSSRLNFSERCRGKAIFLPSMFAIPIFICIFAGETNKQNIFSS